MQISGNKVITEPIVFIGSGPVAAASLKLLANSFTIEAIITKPRPVHHHGSVPVIEAAKDLDIPLIQVADKAELSKEIAESHFTSQIAVLIDFGIIVKQDVIDAFPLGIVNSHFSLLPEWRGADPITFAILSGQHRTGISLMLLVEAMDEGPLLAQVPYDMALNETTPSLTKVLIELSDQCIREILPLYISGKIVPVPQETGSLATSAESSYSRKLTKEDGILDFSKPSFVIEREVRAYLEWPKSHAIIADKDVVITAGHTGPSTLPEGHVIGAAFIVNKELCMQTGDGTLIIDSLKPAGKPEMSGHAFIAGYGYGL